MPSGVAPSSKAWTIRSSSTRVPATRRPPCSSSNKGTATAWRGMFMSGPLRLLLPARLVRLGRAAGLQLVQILADLLRGQARQARLRGQDGQETLQRQRQQGLLLLLRRQPREVLLDVLAVEVLHRERHGKALPSKPL